jgi:valyl-tRNA synthetase
MDPRYDIQEVESRIYKKWEDSGFFNPDTCVEKGVTPADAEPFSIILPPPNVTGELHMGHAAMLVVEDILVRFARMRGRKTLWVPGTDHAAIATQSKVEKELTKTEKKSRYDLGREEFLRRVNEFASKSHDTIVRQIKRMGASLDWSREAYTLDAARARAVNAAFAQLYDMGLIYRGNRIVNWDPKGQTVISDDEVVYEERQAKLYTFRYGKLADGSLFPIPVATTRPETKVGDTGVAVHPSDKRYAQFVGREFAVDFCGVPLKIKVVADEAVDPAFGTGAVGVTPAHSMTDWEMAERHKLPLVQVIDEHARMMVAGPLQGKKVLEAREWIVEELRKDGLLEKEEEITQNVGTAERTGAVIEPLPKLQWFIAVDKPFKRTGGGFLGLSGKTTLKKLMHDAVAKDGIAIIPEHFEKIYFNWIDNLHDWCISRQIWFGHCIPVWYCMACGEPHVNARIRSKWFLVRHGETDYNKEHRIHGQSDVPLNEIGRTQARSVATLLKEEKIDAIISSDLARAKETADIIGKEVGVKVFLEKRLRETHFGVLEGQLIDDVDKRYGKFTERPYKSLGAEAFEEVEKRAMEALREHQNNHEYKNVVVVTHGGIINLIRKNIKKLTLEESALSVVGNANAILLEIGDPCKKCGGDFYEQDPDTLDTWFSSGLWPFSVLGWPEKTRDLATYFPNSVLETGYDILFFWVARMVLMSTALTGEIPFKKVYLHGLVRDAKGRKMSKSLGNGIDPLEMADKYGADATRMSLVIGASAGNDLKLSEDRIRGYRNFSTKIWNIARFIQMNKPATNADGGSARADAQADRAEIKELAALRKEVTGHLEAFEFHLAGEKLYHYLWHELADKIVEAEKPHLRDGTAAEKAASYALLETLLLDALKMLHPFMPFVTEEIHGIFRPGALLMVEKW